MSARAVSLTGNDELSSTHAGGKLFVWKVCTGRGNNGWRSKGAAVQRGQAMTSTLTWVLIFQDVPYNFMHSCKGLIFQDVSYNFTHSPILSDRKTLMSNGTFAWEQRWIPSTKKTLHQPSSQRSWWQKVENVWKSRRRGKHWDSRRRCLEREREKN